MAWTEEQKKEHSKRMKAMWKRKALEKRFASVYAIDNLINSPAGKLAQDTVNHPAHYTAHPSGIECIQVTEHMNFCRGNAIKYIWRAGDKGSMVEDLRKAKWYIEREIERIENAQV